MLAAALPTARGAADICRGEEPLLSIFFDYYLLNTNSSSLKEGFDIDDDVKALTEYTLELELFDRSAQVVIDKIDQLALSTETKDVSDNVAGYIARKLQKVCQNCCDHELFSDNDDASAYLTVLSRGGLKVASPQLQSFVTKSFAVLDAFNSIIRKSGIPVRKVGEHE